VYLPPTGTSDYLLEKFESLIDNVMAKYLPIRKIRIKRGDKPWITSEMKKLLNKRDNRRIRFNLTRSPDDGEYYRQYKYYVRAKLNLAEDNYYKEKLSVNTQPKDLYKTCNKILGNKENSSIPITRMNVNNEPTDDHVLIFDAFASCFELEPNSGSNILTEFGDGELDVDTSGMVIKERDVSNALYKLYHTSNSVYYSTSVYHTSN
jgi:hypothetical protein